MKNEGTRETMPLHIFLHEVELAAIAKGADCETAREPEVRARLIRAYNAGEPVWMVADELAFRSKRLIVECRADREHAALAGMRSAAFGKFGRKVRRGEGR